MSESFVSPEMSLEMQITMGILDVERENKRARILYIGQDNWQAILDRLPLVKGEASKTGARPEYGGLKVYIVDDPKHLQVV